MKRFILVGMMSDAGVCLLVLLRFFDTEWYSAIQASSQIHRFAEKGHWLFVGENAHRNPKTMTFRILKNLERNKVAKLGNLALNIGGYDVGNIFARMLLHYEVLAGSLH